MIVRRRPDPRTDVIWATPTSGYGHGADEQPLPYVHRNGLELTPRFGGEESLAPCAPETWGLPHGVLAEPWAPAQRWFNLPRRPINRYWRHALRTRCRGDRRFLFAEQLDFEATPDGFVGSCPLLRFERRLVVGPSSVQVDDAIQFSRALRFATLDVVVVPLFTDWAVGPDATRRLECEGFRLEPGGAQQSSAGSATLWVERLRSISFSVGERLARRYVYRWEGAA